MNWKKYNESMFYIIVIGIIGIAFQLLIFHYDYEQKYYLDLLRDHVVDNNLELLDGKDFAGNYYSDRDLLGFYEYVKNNFEYSEGLKDCKYWSLVWAMYLEKQGVDYKIVPLDKHVYIVADYPHMHCTLDQDNVNCINYNIKDE